MQAKKRIDAFSADHVLVVTGATPFARKVLLSLLIMRAIPIMPTMTIVKDAGPVQRFVSEEFLKIRRRHETFHNR